MKHMLLVLFAFACAQISSHSDKEQFDALALQQYMHVFLQADKRCAVKNNNEQCFEALDMLNRIVLLYRDALRGERNPGQLLPSFHDKEIRAETQEEMNARMRALSTRASEEFTNPQ